MAVLTLELDAPKLKEFYHSEKINTVLERLIETLDSAKKHHFDKVNVNGEIYPTQKLLELFKSNLKTIKQLRGIIK